jgi:YhcH/YjgK/YiaL family protein
MIIDQIKFIERYKNLDERVGLALNFLKNTDFSSMKPGIYQVSGDDIFYMINDYKTKPVKDGILEGHKKYIDIQSIITGSELIGYAPLSNQLETEVYDSEKDYALYKGHSSLVQMKPGMFAIFYPNDLHMPGLNDIETKVKKLILKVKIT